MRPLDMLTLRYALARLMDQSAAAVTKRRYDLDDTISDRFAELALAGASEVILVECGFLTEEARLVERFRESYAARFGRGAVDRPVELRGARIRTTITTTKPMPPA